MAENTDSTANAGDNTNASAGGSSTFSQEDVDRIVNDRLARERKKFEGFDDYKAAAERVPELESTLAETNEQLSTYKTREEREALVNQVAEATGLQAAVVGSLSGSTAEELTQQANGIKPFIGTQRVVIPNAGDAPDKKTSPESDFVGNLFGQGN